MQVKEALEITVEHLPGSALRIAGLMAGAMDMDVTIQITLLRTDC